MRGRIHVSVALRQIEGVIVSLPAVTEGLSVIDPDSDTCMCLKRDQLLSLKIQLLDDETAQHIQ